MAKMAHERVELIETSEEMGAEANPEVGVAPRPYISKKVVGLTFIVVAVVGLALRLFPRQHAQKVNVGPLPHLERSVGLLELAHIHGEDGVVKNAAGKAVAAAAQKRARAFIKQHVVQVKAWVNPNYTFGGQQSLEYVGEVPGVRGAIPTVYMSRLI